MAHTYVIAATWVHNEEILDAYKRLAGPSVLKFGGEYLVATDQIDLLIGEARPDRFAIVRFESKEMAQQWWNSEEYREARKLRTEAGASQILIVEGK